MRIHRNVLYATLTLLALSATASEWFEVQRKEERRQLVETERSVEPTQPRSLAADEPYAVEIGVYGMDEPSIRPSETWIWFACFSQPRRSYRDFPLMRVEIRVRHTDGVWDSRDEDKDGGICDINQGIDASFIAIPRGLAVRSWTLFVENAEQRDMNVRVVRQTIATPHVYRGD